MANMIQLVMYEGRLGDDPEMRYTATGTAVTNISMASTREWKDAEGEKVKEVTWLKVAFWGKLGEIVNQYCGKGSHVIVEGTLKPSDNGTPRAYTLKSGDPAASFELTGKSIRILKGKSGDNQEREYASQDDDDLPF